MKNTRVLWERITFNPQIMGGRACIKGDAYYSFFSVKITMSLTPNQFYRATNPSQTLIDVIYLRGILVAVNQRSYYA